MPDNRKRNVGDGDDQEDDRGKIVDAELDPVTKKINELEANADEDAGFARLEADFANAERIHAAHLDATGRASEAAHYKADATRHMLDARQAIDQSNAETQEADELRAQQLAKFSRALQQMPDQSIEMLRVAVSELRLAVQNLSEMDTMHIIVSAQFDESRIAEMREIVVTKGHVVERALADPNRLRRDPHQVIRDLVAFVTAVTWFADHLPKLMAVVQQFGQLLLQFR